MLKDMPEMKKEVFTGKEDLSFFLREINRISKRLDHGIYETDNPHKVAAEIKLFTDIQFITGELLAVAVSEYEHAKLERKDEYNRWMDTLQGSEASKKISAERKVNELAKKEAQTKAQRERWERAYNNAEQQANALKKYLEIVWHEYKLSGS